MKTATVFLTDLKNTSEVDFLIEQLLPDSTQALMLICGQPGIGKTNLSLYTAFCLATGTKFFDFKTKPCEVGYLFMEAGPHQIGNRVEKLSNHFGGIPDNLHIEQHEPMPLYPKNKVELEKIVTGLRICFVDALKYLIPGDYMKPSDVLKGLTTIQEVQNETACIFVLIGHIRKPNLKILPKPDDYWTELKGPTEYMEMANSALMLTRPRHPKDSKGHFVSNENLRHLCIMKARDSTIELKPIELLFDRERLLFLPQSDGFEEAQEGW